MYACMYCLPIIPKQVVLGHLLYLRMVHLKASILRHNFSRIGSRLNTLYALLCQQRCCKGIHWHTASWLLGGYNCREVGKFLLKVTYVLATALLVGFKAKACLPSTPGKVGADINTQGHAGPTLAEGYRGSSESSTKQQMRPS